MRRLAILSLHTSPLAQPGVGDGGGMNVYVRELATALARAGTECDVYTRAWSPSLPAQVRVEPGFVVHHVPAGPLAPVPKEQLPPLVEEFTEGVRTRIVASGERPDLVHANYWLSGLVGHRLKHDLELPLICTFHTLDRVKADASPEEVLSEEPARRSAAEAEVIGCADAVLASCDVEAAQLCDLYGADPTRVAIVAPGVDHAIFGPGNRDQARRALGLDPDRSFVLFVGRIQPLKGVELALEALAEVLASPGEDRAELVVIGGPSGPRGPETLGRLRRRAAEPDLAGRVSFVPPQPHELLATWYRSADVAIVPSRSESFGLVALEAAACGVPVVATDVGGLRSLVDDGETGYLVSDRRPSAFAAPLGRLLADGQLATRLGSAAARRGRRYTWAAAGRRLRDLCGQLADRDLVECR